MLLNLLAASTCSNVEYLCWSEYPYLDRSRTEESYQMVILWMICKIAHTRYLSLARLSCVFASFCKSHLKIRHVLTRAAGRYTPRLYCHDNHISGIYRAPWQKTTREQWHYLEKKCSREQGIQSWCCPQCPKCSWVASLCWPAQATLCHSSATCC